MSATLPPFPSDESVTRAKTDLRRLAKARRAALDVTHRLAASQALATFGLAFLEGRVMPNIIVGGFMPIGEEISPLPLMARLHDEGYRLALPVMMGKSAPLEFRAYDPGDPLDQVVWGIREPQAGREVVEPHIVLTALLAFDERGYRLGYGGGYYDRTIRQLRRTKDVITLGLAYDEQRVDAVPHLDYDERLDWILTPSGPCQIRP